MLIIILVFEQAVSALAPKKAIDNVIRVSDAGVPSHYHGVRPFRYLLREIEHVSLFINSLTTYLILK